MRESEERVKWMRENKNETLNLKGLIAMEMIKKKSIIKLFTPKNRQFFLRLYNINITTLPFSIGSN